MLERLNRGDASRMRGDLEAAIEYLPGLASLALWCRFADTDEDAIAYTDGSTIYAGADYEKLEPKERRFICLHEILHVALCHPQRFIELEKRDAASFNPKLLNIAADAIINESLENLTGLKTPTDAWTLARIWQCLEKAEDAADPAAAKTSSPYYSFSAAAQARKIANLTRAEFILASRWSCEELYYFLKSRCRTQTEVYGILAEFDERDRLAGDLRSKACGECKRFKTCKTCDTPNAESVEREQKRNWQQRLSLLRGSVPELFQRLAGELPRVETPWEQIFRSLVQTAFQEATQNNYSRPSRRWLALEKDYCAQAGVNLPFAPDITKKRGTRLAVALDTSGSIDEGLLGRFLAEIAAMCAYNQRNLVLLVGDAAVHQIVEIDWREVSRELSALQYTGGGGTDFRPLIAAVAEYEPDALVYLTDLYGETGDEPSFPVIWATHGAAGKAPWGEQINLE
ncbi:MAG: VWA-like domain-containing protein [Acidobacteriota bacterium]|nr:VWA-like domain-containing protein [Acidobacteriota bacterium]